MKSTTNTHLQLVKSVLSAWQTIVTQFEFSFKNPFLFHSLRRKYFVVNRCFGTLSCLSNLRVLLVVKKLKKMICRINSVRELRYDHYSSRKPCNQYAIVRNYKKWYIIIPSVPTRSEVKTNSVRDYFRPEILYSSQFFVTTMTFLKQIHSARRTNKEKKKKTRWSSRVIFRTRYLITLWIITMQLLREGERRIFFEKFSNFYDISIEGTKYDAQSLNVIYI